MTKLPFLVLYDYGMGGVYAIIYASAKSEILHKYPMLDVLETRPEWMTNDLYETTRANRSFDIDDEPTGWLLTVLDERRGGPSGV